MGLLQTVVAVALFFVASLKSVLQVPVGSPYRSWPVLFLKLHSGAFVQLRQCGSAARVLIQAANKAHHSRPASAGMPTATRSSPVCFALGF
ncbi:hypothetical protein ACQ661_12445 [Pseudidiomarina sp. WS423]|uniref:hypothetical protein n=1 Tax=Pseudidiomarina sp. WS423 TaxID=3425124 RepID=UPI003D6DA9FF